MLGQYVMYLLFCHYSRQSPVLYGLNDKALLPVNKMHMLNNVGFSIIKYSFVTTVNKGEVFKNFFTGHGQII